MNRTWEGAARTACAVVALAATGAIAQERSAVEEIERYRQALGDGNPAELWEARGEGLWKEKAGPKNASLEKCDLGLGPGVVRGAYAQLPRYFADTGKVEDLESRLVSCRVALQGISPEEAKKSPFGGPGRKTVNDALVAYITSESRGVKMNVQANHPKEAEAYEIGRKIFFHRGGPYDFACATCHGVDNIRIRLQDLPNLTKQADAQRAYTSWPAYRVSQGEVRTFQWRLEDCFRQQRFPHLDFTSEASIALTMFLARNANGATFNAPSIKR
ncbi:MAG: sulfur oxidation c-type cytochrome SoxA [Betaproteobacteria bacterium]|nr:sulfur oxidation c-type cytochrome SoxA [Betaproteobacteria bacterium]